MATATATGGAPSPITGRAKSNYATVIKRIKSKVFHFSFATFYDLPAWSNGRVKVVVREISSSNCKKQYFFFQKRRIPVAQSAFIKH